MTTEYMSITDVVERTGISRTTILYRVRENTKGFPRPDAIIRHDKLVTYGWLPEAIDNYIITNKKKENKND